MRVEFRVSKIYFERPAWVYLLAFIFLLPDLCKMPRLAALCLDFGVSVDFTMIGAYYRDFSPFLKSMHSCCSSFFVPLGFFLCVAVSRPLYRRHSSPFVPPFFFLCVKVLLLLCCRTHSFPQNSNLRCRSQERECRYGNSISKPRRRV